MPLFNIEERRMSTVHQDTLANLRASLSAARIQRITAALDSVIDRELSRHNETPLGGSTTHFIDSHLPKRPFRSIYHIAAKRDELLAGKMFGLLIWEGFRRRRERWLFVRPPKDSPYRDHPMGLTYFRPFKEGERIAIEFTVGPPVVDIYERRDSEYMTLRKRGQVRVAAMKRYWHPLRTSR
ncbi:MAG TPA: hypothetical protein VNK23_07330 [Candidatus Dormibacteraeota bacterium]|nr:hypothetical protein [Candidatus Dormibacteraeota bacterium]